VSLDEVDAIRVLLEPGTAVAGTIALHDDSGAEPIEYVANTIYGWALRDVFHVEGTGQLDVQDFTARFAYVADLQDEIAAGTRLRSVSLLLDAKFQAYAATIRANRARASLWEHLAVSAVEWDAIRALEKRGFFLDVAGYRLLT
jgi:hypothetical protein